MPETKMFHRFLRLPKTAHKIQKMAFQDTKLSGDPSNLSWNAREDFFSYTRGRFARNEAYEMSQRYVRFNMDELARIAAQSVGSKSCVSVEKFADGMFNKAFLLTMHDVKQVVGKVPNPNAGRPHYTTASEIASMDFARNILGTPVPKVLAWSSNASENPVGAEYIIMEKTPGVPLQQVWSKMRIEDRFEVAKAIARLQKPWMSISFCQYGSLYFSKDLKGSGGCRYLKTDGTEVQNPQYTVGPSVGRDFFDDGRQIFDFDRGPWNTAKEYEKAIGQRELFCVQNTTQFPPSPITLCGPGTYKPSRAGKVAALRHYLELAPYLLPTDPSIIGSYLWHGDLHSENIFVNPDNPSKVLGIIDWQSTQLLPLYEHARQPYFLDYDGPPVVGLEPPEFPGNIDQLSPAERQKAHARYLDMSLSALYRTFIHGTNKNLYRAMEFQESTSFDMLVFARNLYIDGEALYCSRVVDLEKDWDSLPEIQARGNPPFPFHFSSDDLNTINKDATDAIRGMKYMEDLKTELGDLWPEKGLVRHDQYNDMTMALLSTKKRLVSTLAHSDEDRKAWESSWPFHD